MAVEALFEGEAEKIGRACITRALEGDATALKLVVERLVPLRRGRPLTFNMPDIASASDLCRALGAVLAAVASGDVTVEEAVGLAQVVEARRRSIETTELEARIAALEGGQ